jgi:hypothetical protein
LSRWCEKCKDNTIFGNTKKTTLLVDYNEDGSEFRVDGFEGKCNECGFEDAWVF